MLFSIIIPIYNVEKYLRDCLESIITQSFDDYEVIMADDGSPDGCRDIIDGYALRDTRFKPLHKANGGLVSARKAGILKAAGDYIINVDGDDRLAPGVLKRAAEIITAHTPDIISFFVENSDKKDGIPPGLYEGAAMAEKIRPCALLSENGEHLPYYICGKVLKRSVFMANQLAVDDRIAFAEDVSAVIPTIFRANSFFAAGETGYIITVRSESMSRKFYMGMFDELIMAVRGLSATTPEAGGQLDRYCLYECLVLMQTALLSGGMHSTSELKAKILDETLQAHIKKAKFRKITLKARIFYFLIRKNMVGAARLVLRIANKVKG